MDRFIRSIFITVILYFAYEFTKMYIEYYNAFNTYNKQIEGIRGNRLVRYLFQEPTMPVMPHEFLCIFLIPFILSSPIVLFSFILINLFFYV